MQKEYKNYNEIVAERDMGDPNETIYLKETNFGFVFGSFDKELPIEIGRITPYYVEAYWEDDEKKNRTRNATPLDYEDCTPDDISFFGPAGKIFCINEFDRQIELEGNYYHPEFKFINIVLELCPSYGERLGVECSSATEMTEYF